MEVIAKVVREDDIAQGEGTEQDVKGASPAPGTRPQRQSSVIPGSQGRDLEFTAGRRQVVHRWVSEKEV